ncbi:hypothetical protein CFOL_v3_24761 [Cephalotus follicularis]|uniref:Uncharacterized protein n=1 Tax=Cephalotus follicularis TaxID=3775 RepID=A0A1Q3CMI1_CEPFO|nr:hypothetical protein CFOL_v3_24761 [Cephalotus follicularis]
MKGYLDDVNSSVGFLNLLITYSCFYGPLEMARRHYYCSLLCYSIVPCDGRQDYRGRDLREKLDRRHSPQRRNTPGRDARGQYTSHGYSPSKPLEKTSDRKRRKKGHLDGQSDFSGSLKFSERAEFEGKNTSSDSKIFLKEQLKEVLSDINILDHHKLQLGVNVEEKVQEADSLMSRIQELEAQLAKEKEDYKRATSKIKKFVKAHNQCSKIQDDLRRSQVRLHKLGDQLGPVTTRTAGNEEDSSINILSDGERISYPIINPQNEKQIYLSLDKEGLRFNGETVEEPIPGGYCPESIGLKKHSEGNVHTVQSHFDRVEVIENGNNSHAPLANEGKGRNSITPTEKSKNLALGLVLPSTSMAAHADDVVDEIENEKIEVLETVSRGTEKVGLSEVAGLPFSLPPPPLPDSRSSHSRYEGDDEYVDVEGLEEATVDVDIV